MSIRTVIIFVFLILPAMALLVFGPRGKYNVPPGRTVIRYWEKWSGVERETMESLVDEFNSTVGKEKNIWVEYCSIGNIDQRTLIATAGGDPPDVAGLYDWIVPQFASQGALLELDELVKDYGIEKDSFKPVWWEIGEYEGHLYALPSAPYTIALLYNKKLFREAGLDPEKPPQTTAEFSECYKKLTKWDDEGRIVQLGFTPSSAMLGWWHWIWPFFFDARPWDGHDFHLDTPEALAAYNWIVDDRLAISRNGGRDILDFEGGEGEVEGPSNPFLAGKVAMMFQGPWMCMWAEKYMPDLEYGVARFPSVSLEQENVFASTDVFAIPASSKHPDEAMMFLSWLMRQENMERLCQGHGKVSPFRVPGEDFYANHPNQHIRFFDELAAGDHVFGHPKMPTFSHASSEMRTLLENILTGSLTPEEAVRRTQERAEKAVKENQKMLNQRKGVE